MASHMLKLIHVPFLDQTSYDPAQLMHSFVSRMSIPKDKQVTCSYNFIVHEVELIQYK